MDTLEQFICMLIDKSEGEIITEEFLQRKYADFLDSHYNSTEKGR